MTVNLPKEIAWLGPLPPDYAIVRLGFLVSQVNEKNIGMRSKNLLSLSYGNIKNRDIQSADGLLPESFETYNCIKKDDIVLRMTDLQNDKRSLRSAISTQDGIITSAYITLRCKKIYPKFLAYYLRCLDNAKVFYSMGSGLRQSLTWDDIRKLPVAVPPLDKQKRIADELDRELADIDEIIANLEATQLLLDEKYQLELNDLFWGEANELVPLKRFVKFVDQGSSPIADSNPAEANEIGILKAGCTAGGEFNIQANKKVIPGTPIKESIFIKEGDLLVTRASGSKKIVGSAAIVGKLDRQLALSDKIYRFHTDNPEISQYLRDVMATRQFREQLELEISGAEGLAKNISIKSLISIKIPNFDKEKIYDSQINSMNFEDFEKLEIILKNKKQAIVQKKIRDV